MKIVNYADAALLCDELLDEVETKGITVEIHKDGRPFVRIMPVDEATKALFECRDVTADE